MLKNVRMKKQEVPQSLSKKFFSTAISRFWLQIVQYSSMYAIHTPSLYCTIFAQNLKISLRKKLFRQALKLKYGWKSGILVQKQIFLICFFIGFFFWYAPAGSGSAAVAPVFAAFTTLFTSIVLHRNFILMNYQFLLF